MTEREELRKQRMSEATRRWRDKNSISPSLYKAAKSSAKRRGIEWNVTKEEVDKIIERSNGKCELTGIEFSSEKLNLDTRRFPFKASLDRIDNTLGYTFDNLRLVCVAVNIAMNQFGDQLLEKISRAFMRKQEDIFNWEEVCVYL